MSTVEQERESEVVVGTITGITQKRPDTWTVAVTPDGSQYSRNLWTKDVGLVQALQNGYLNQRLAFDCGVSHWTNQQNQPVRSLWINGASEAPPVEAQPAQIGQAVQQQQTALGLPVAQPQEATVVPLTQAAAPAALPQAAPVEADKETRIMRQTAAKCATNMLATLPPDERTFQHLVLIAEGWFAYFVEGREAIPGVPPRGEVQGTGQPLQMPIPAPGQFAADDIPF